MRTKTAWFSTHSSRITASLLRRTCYYLRDLSRNFHTTLGGPAARFPASRRVRSPNRGRLCIAPHGPRLPIRYSPGAPNNAETAPGGTAPQGENPVNLLARQHHRQPL